MTPFTLISGTPKAKGKQPSRLLNLVGAPLMALSVLGGGTAVAMANPTPAAAEDDGVFDPAPPPGGEEEDDFFDPGDRPGDEEPTQPGRGNGRAQQVFQEISNRLNQQADKFEARGNQRAADRLRRVAEIHIDRLAERIANRSR